MKISSSKYFLPGYYLVIGLFFLFLIFNSFVGKTIFKKYRFLVVSSDSMEPALKKSQIVLIKSNSYYYPNEMITFYQDDLSQTITHRVMKTELINNQEYYFTQGDSNEVADGWIKHNRVLGKVIYSGFRLLGALILLHTNFFGAQLVIIWLPVAIIVYLELKKIVLELKIKKII